MAISGKDTKIIYGGFDLSTNFSSVTASRNIETVDVTTFNPTSGFRTMLPTIESGSISLDGFFDGSANSVDEELQGALGGTSVTPLSFAQAGLTRGNKVVLLSSDVTNNEIGSEVAGAVSVSATAEGGFIGNGVSLKDLSAETSATDHTSVDHGALTSNGATAFLHITAKTGTPGATIKVQDSADNTSFSDFATFTLDGSSVGSQIKAVSGTVNRYLRVTSAYTGGSFSLTYAVVIARKLK